MVRRRSRFVPPKGAMTVKEAAEATGYSVARISKLLGENRIVGSFKRKGRRLIPIPVKYLTTKGEEKLLDKSQRGRAASVVDPNEVRVTGENSFYKAGAFGGCRIHYCCKPLAGIVFSSGPGPRIVHAIRPDG